MPHKPFVCIAADMAQLRPVGSGSGVERALRSMQKIELTTIYRSTDPDHLVFLNKVRDTQPDRKTLRKYFEGRHWQGGMKEAVLAGLKKQAAEKTVFTWLTVSNKGAAKVNEIALELHGITAAMREQGYPGDPKVDSSGIVVKPGIVVRMTRNVDKPRGYVNGAIGIVKDVLWNNSVFTVELSTGSMILVHPLREYDRSFLPCTYGYATTIRRAQGATLDHGCLYFDLKFPPDRGYAYVAASRFRTRAGVFLFGKLRKTDWLPVGPVCETEQVQRSMESMSDNSEDDWHREMDDEYGSSEGESDWDDDKEEDNVFTCQSGLREGENAMVSDFDGLNADIVFDLEHVST